MGFTPLPRLKGIIMLETIVQGDTLRVKMGGTYGNEIIVKVRKVTKTQFVCAWVKNEAIEYRFNRVTGSQVGKGRYHQKYHIVEKLRG